MIEITKGNPTSEEIAALVAVLMLVGGAHHYHAPPAPRRVNGDEPRGSPKSIRGAPSRAGVGGLALAPRTPRYRHRVQWGASRNVS